MVGWKSYHDQRMSEGFAEFSASLFVQLALKDEHKFLDFWNQQHDRFTQSRPISAIKHPISCRTSLNASACYGKVRPTSRWISRFGSLGGRFCEFLLTIIE